MFKQSDFSLARSSWRGSDDTRSLPWTRGTKGNAARRPEMNLRLFQGLMELNLAFEQVIRGL